MKTLALTHFGNPILRKKAKRLRISTIKKTSFQKLVARMFFTMHKVDGVGLAAPQINKSVQLAVIEFEKNKIRPHILPISRTVIINPKIMEASKKMTYDWEGCLSFSDGRGLVPRHEKITVEYIDQLGKKRHVNLAGFHARVFQHEIDHLNGIVYVDRMRDMKTLMTAAEFKKRIVKKGLKSR